MDTAIDAFLRGNLQKAELLCRQVLSKQPDNGQALMLLGRIAQCIGEAAQGDAYLRVAQSHVRQGEIHRAPLAPPTAATAPPRASRYLLIKSWGFGFWSDLDHVYGALLVAELTGRTPLIHWGKNSLFRNKDTANAYESFFVPVSDASWADISAPGLSYYPPKWTRDNLALEDHQKWSGEGARMGGLYLLNRNEDVVVSDFHVKLNDLIPWIPEGSPYHGMQRSEIYRHLNEKYIHLKPHLARKIDDVWQQQMAHQNWLAVHIRGTDKVYEVDNLSAINGAYEARIDRILSVNPSLALFLLTDSTQVAQQFQAKYGERLLSLDCQRGSGTTGVHLEGHPGTEMGEQVILDAFLASRCDFFLGNGGSNVSLGIRHLKSWPQGTFFLIGSDFLGEVDLSLHEW